MHKFDIIEGARSQNYNTFEDYTFDSCIATDTRLMGVVALKISLSKNDNSGRIMTVIMHLDFSEYGVDEYMEFFHESYAAMRSSPQCREFWDQIAGSLGGAFVEIPPGVMLNLIDSALKINQSHFAKHDIDIREFRNDMLVKVDKLHQAYDAIASAESYSSDESIDCVSPKNLSAYETINYFVMRMADMDFLAASYLSDLNEDMLDETAFTRHGLSSLIRNRIYNIDDPAGDERIYRCNALTQNDFNYFFSELDITLRNIDGRWQVSAFDAISSAKISSFEAAMQTRQAEYITVYDISTPANIPDRLDTLEMLLNYKWHKVEVPCGTMYAIYKENNDHVNSDDYFISHDLFGAYLITPLDELILMSHEIERIYDMEKEIDHVLVYINPTVVGRYKFDSQVFQTFTMTEDMFFADIITGPDE